MLDGADDRSEPDDPGGSDPLQGIYDPDTLAAVDAWAPTPLERAPEPSRREVGPQGSPARLRRGPRGLGMALLAGTTLGLRESLEGSGDHEALVELDPQVEPTEQWITFLHVPGEPRASRIIVRPWLRPRR